MSAEWLDTTNCHDLCFFKCSEILLMFVIWRWWGCNQYNWWPMNHVILSVVIYCYLIHNVTVGNSWLLQHIRVNILMTSAYGTAWITQLCLNFILSLPANQILHQILLQCQQFSQKGHQNVSFNSIDYGASNVFSN